MSTIEDFSEQWSNYQSNEGFFGSEQLLQDYFGDMLPLESLRGKSVAEFGCGNGRFLKLFSPYAEQVVGVEPSDAQYVAQKYVEGCANVSVVGTDVYALALDQRFDVIFCLGVLHHVPDPIQFLKKIRQHLKEGGQAVVWIYGKEGNELYLLLLALLRPITVRLPHRLLHLFSWMLVWPLRLYGFACKFMPLPLRGYLLKVLNKCDNATLELVIYDQLNPRIANFWTDKEFTKILNESGFAVKQLYHRHGYSWTAIAEAQHPATP